MAIPVLPVLVVGGLMLFSGMKTPGKKTGKTRPAQPPPPELEEAVAYCQAQGGEVADYETTEGEIVAVCTFPDGRMAEVLAYYRGEAAPDCPAGMVFDQSTGECVIPSGPDVPGDPQEALALVMCTSLYVQAWRPWNAQPLALDPAVAANLEAILYSRAEEALQTTNDLGLVLADLWLIGMTHIAPACDFEGYMAAIQTIREEGLPLPMTEEEANKVDEVSESVAGIAEAMLAMAVEVGEPAPQAQGGGLTPGQQGGGMVPEQQGKLCPDGYFYDAVHDVCCPDGFYWDVDEQMCRPFGYAGRTLQARRYARRRADAVRFGGRRGYAGGCGGRRGHCGVRPRT